MTDQNVTPNGSPRVFKIGATRIVEDASMSSLDNNSIRDLLKTTYLEIANATMRETTLQSGSRGIEWITQPGRKC